MFGHFATLCIKGLIKFSRKHFRNIILSSEKLQVLVFYSKKKIPFKNILNSNRPRTDPCGTLREAFTLMRCMR